MSELPPSPASADDVDDQYRRASALDTSCPSEPARRAVLAHATQLAAERRAELAAKRVAKNATGKLDIAPQADARLPRAQRTWWRPAIIGTLAAAALAGLLITPQFLRPRAPQPGPLSASEPSRAGTDAVSVQRPADYLSARRDPAAALRRAAETGDVGGLHALLDNPAILDARDADGRTALMLATLHGQLPAVDALLESGADPNAADVRGMTPLQAAQNGGQPEIAAALRRAGAR